MAMSKAEKALRRKLSELDEQIADQEKTLDRLRTWRQALLQVADEAGVVIELATAEDDG